MTETESDKERQTKTDRLVESDKVEETDRQTGGEAGRQRKRER